MTTATRTKVDVVEGTPRSYFGMDRVVEPIRDVRALLGEMLPDGI